MMQLLQPERRGDFKAIGRLPETALLYILTYCTLPDVRALSLTCRRLAALAKDDRIWDRKLALLAFKGFGEHTIARTATAPSSALKKRTSLLPPPKSVANKEVNGVAQVHTKTPEILQDDFGDFVESSFEFQEAPITSMQTAGNDLLMSFDDEQDLSMPKVQQHKRTHSKSKMKDALPASPTSFKPDHDSLKQFKRLFSLLLPFYTSLQTHTTSSLVFTQAKLTPMEKAHILRTLTHLLIPALSPTRSTATLTVFKRNLQSSIDYYEGALLTEFENADEKKNEDLMRLTAAIATELNGGSSIAQVFLNKREIFYEASSLYNPLLNLVKTPKDGSHGSKNELVDGIDFSAMDQFMTFVLEVLKRDGSLCARIFPPRSNVLLEFADRISQDVISEYITPLLSAAQSLQHPLFMLATAATFAQILRLIPTTLAIEPKQPAVTQTNLENVIHRMFEIHMDDYLSEEADWIKVALNDICSSWTSKVENMVAPAHTFLTAANPAQVKKNVLQSFGKALLMPVTIVPKTVAYSFTAVTTGAFNAVVSITGAGPSTPSASVTQTPAVEHEDSFRKSFEDNLEKSDNAVANEVTPPAKIEDQYAKLQLLLSLDVALQLIQADRESLKRVETFAGFAGAIGAKVTDTIEEIFIVLLQTLGDKHIVPAFQSAEKHMSSYKPDEHGEKGQTSVAPLVQFFELVHVGDTISQMIQAYYDKEMALFIDRTDFLNIAVREKKKFETALDDSVASGLNTGVHLLMNQADHLLSSLQDPTDYCPLDTSRIGDGPTKACLAVIDCLKAHCDLLKGSTDKQILEVFYCEIGIRLHALILKHLKRSIVSPEGGLQVISDISAYHAFIVSLKQASITPYFHALKLVVNLYLVDSPKDMAALVKDVQRYDGTLRSEDAYELLQRRTDWRQKEKAVDKALYGLSKEDCTII